MFENDFVQVNRNGHDVDVLVWDIAGVGVDYFYHLRRVAYVGTDVFVICYSPDKPESFQSILKQWIPEVGTTCHGASAIVVCCKADLRGRGPAEEVEEDVASEIVGTYDHGLKVVQYYEVSSYEHSATIDTIFSQALEICE